MKDKTTTQSIKPNKERSQLDVIPDLEIKTKQNNKGIGYLWDELHTGKLDI